MWTLRNFVEDFLLLRATSLETNPLTMTVRIWWKIYWMRIEILKIVFSIVLTTLPTMLLPSIWRLLTMQTKTF